MGMRGSYSLAGLVVVAAGLAVVALAWAQPTLNQPATPTAKPGASPAAPPTKSVPPPMVIPALPPLSSAPAPVAVPPPQSLPPGPPKPDEAGSKESLSLPPTPTVSEPSPTLELQPAATEPKPQEDSGASKAPVPAVVPGSEKPKEIPVVPARGPLAHQEPAISLEWVGPPTARFGHATDYSLVARNTSSAAVQEVMIRVRIPQGLTVMSTEPKGLSEGNVYAWELGTLMAKQEKTLQFRFLAEGRGDMTPQAWITFTGSSMARIQIREPKLALKSSAPERVLVGDTATFTFTVSNVGDGPAEQVRVNATLSEGLEHPRGNKVAFEVGNLAPGETRNVQVICSTRGGGEQKCEGVVEAEGGLKAQGQSAIHVIMPKLELQLVGPALRYVDRKAAYTVRVNNPGDAPATNVTVSEVMPAGFKFVSASDGGRLDVGTRTVSWFLGEIGPGQAREVKMEALAAAVGDQLHQAVAQAARGLRVDADLTTRVEGLSALVLEVDDTEDPIEMGGTMTYEVKVTNNGSKNESDIKLVCLIPDKMELKNVQAPIRYRQEANKVIFETLDTLAPKGDVQVRLQCKPVIAGDARFTLQVTSSTLLEPVIEMEATRIYADTPPNK